jgi:lipid II:glycine glycyltransferase (peptidoglycan interpeptide bridge formation enzyme)
MLYVYDGVLYYPYGGSSDQHRNVFASNLVAWETIQLGKRLGCTSFDMWGAAKDPTDTKDPWWGFTNFKLKFGGYLVEHLDSYDLIINPPFYYLFNLAQKLRWMLLRFLKH